MSNLLQDNWSLLPIQSVLWEIFASLAHVLYVLKANSSHTDRDECGGAQNEPKIVL